MYPYPLIGNYVTLYGIFIAIGILMCIFVLRFLGRKLNIDAKFMDFVEIMGYIAIAFGFLTSWLFQVVYNYSETGIWDFEHSGITFLGGLIGGVGSFLIGYIILRKKLTGRVTDILPIVPCVITIAHAFGRIGCFFAGCCGGREANPNDLFYFLSITFPGDTVRTYPTQIFEAAFLFLLFGVMLYLVLKKDFKYNFVVYLVGYGVWRFLIEFVRGDDRGQIFGLDWITPSQFWSVIMVLGATPVFFLMRKLYKERDKELLLINGNIPEK